MLDVQYQPRNFSSLKSTSDKMEVSENLTRVKLAILNIFTDILRTILSYYTPASHLSETLKGIGIPKENQDLKQSGEPEKLKDKPKTKEKDDMKEQLDNQDTKQPDEREKLINYLNSKRKDDMKKLLENQDLLKWAAENKSYEKLDITLMKALFSIFRELPQMSKTGISKEKDKILVHVVDEIRKTRNTFFHESEHSISEEDFKNIWKDLEKICIQVDEETQNNFSQTLQKYRQCVVDIDVDTPQKFNSLQVKFRHPETFSKEMMRKTELVENWKTDSSRFFPTRAYKEVERRLSLTKTLTVSGNIGSGKSFCAQNVALSYVLKDWIIIPVDDVEEIITRVEKDSRCTQLFVLDDPLGKDHIDERLFSHWKCHESTLTHILNSCDIKVLFTCRINILNDKRMPELLIKEKVVIDDSHWQLTTFEKEQILRLKCVDIVEVSESEKCEILKCNEYYPLLCALFAQKEIYRSKGASFFTSPYLYIRDEIKSFKSSDRVKYCALVTLLERGGSICHDSLSNNREALEIIFQMCKLSSNMSYKCILDELEKMNGSLIEKISGKFTFRSDIVVKATISILQEENQKELVKFCPLGFLRKWIRVYYGVCDKKESSLFLHITITDEIVKVLCDRYFEEMKKNCVEVCLCPVFKDSRVQAFICKRITEMSDGELQDCFLQSLQMGVSQLPPDMHGIQIVFDSIKHLLPDLFENIFTTINDNYFSPISFLSHSLEYLLNNDEFMVSVQSRMRKASSVLNLVNELEKVRDTVATLCENLDDLKNFEANKIFLIEVLKIFETVANEVEENGENEEENKEENEEQDLYPGNEEGNKEENEEENEEQDHYTGNEEENEEEKHQMTKDEQKENQEKRKKQREGEKENEEENEEQDQYIGNEEENEELEEEHKMTKDEQKENQEKQKKQRQEEQMLEEQMDYDVVIKLQQQCYANEWAVKALRFAFPNYIKNVKNEMSFHQEQFLNEFLNNLALHFVNLSTIVENDIGRDQVFNNFTCWKDAVKRFEGLELCFPLIRQRNKKTICKQVLSDILLTSNAPDLPYLSFPSLEQTKLHEDLRGFTSSRNEDIKTELAIYAYRTSPLSCLLMFGEIEIFERVIQRLLSMHFDKRILRQYNLFFSACVSGRLDVAKRILERFGNDVITEKFFCLTFDFSSLHIAPLLNHVEIMDFLLREKHFDVNIADYFGNTPLHLVLYNIEQNLAEQQYEQVIRTIRTLCEFGASTNQQNNMGFSPLHLACQNNNTEIVELFCNEHNINSKTNDGETPLLIAAEKGNAEVVAFLLQHGANSNDKNSEGCTPLYLAAKRGSIQTIEKLLNSNADLNSKNNKGETPLIVAASKGHFDVVKRIIEITSRVDDRDKTGVTALAGAVSSGRLDIVNLLLQHKVNVNLTNNDGNGPLAIAVIKGHIDISEILIRNDADVELRNVNGKSPLMLASKHGQSDIVQLLLDKGAKVNRRDYKKQSSLWHACNNGHTCVTSILIKHDANEKLDDLQGCTPFFTAARHGHIGPLEVLLQTKCPVNQRDSNGKTALMTACENGHVEVVCTLLKYFANANLFDNNGRTALWYASKCGYSNVVEVLLDESVELNKRDKEKKSPLYVAAEEGYIEIVSLLVGRNASMEMCDKEHRSPLSIAVAKGHMFIVKFLINEGADVNTKDIVGGTPLFYAVGTDNKDALLLLIEFGADVGITDKDGNTPLHLAAWKGNISMVRILVDRGNTSSINRQNKFGETAIFLASKNNFIDTVSFLISRNADIYVHNKDGLSPFDVARRNGYNDITALISQRFKLEN